MDSKEPISQRIKAIRIKRNETLEEFAENIRKETNSKLKTNKSNVSKWEKGLNIPNDITLYAIAKLGDVSMTYLLTGEKTFEDLSIKDEIEITNEIKKKHTLKYVDKEIIDFDSYDNAYDLIKTLIIKNKVDKNDIAPLIDQDGELIKASDLHNLVINYNDRDLKKLSIYLSNDIIEQLLIHYYLCKLFIKNSDISKFNSNEKNLYISHLRQEYLFNKIVDKSINIHTDDDFFDGKTIIINGKQLNKKEVNLFLDLINRLF